MKSKVVIILTVVISVFALFGCKSEVQKAAEKYYKTNTLVNKQAYASFIGTEVTGEIKVFDDVEPDTIFTFEVFLSED